MALVKSVKIRERPVAEHSNVPYEKKKIEEEEMQMLYADVDKCRFKVINELVKETNA